jgi:hypothetical protein
MSITERWCPLINSKVSISNTNIQQSQSQSNKVPISSGTNNLDNLTAGLEKGQLIKGEIIDVTFQEIGVQLEDGRVLSGMLEDAANLSIGDKVTFRIEDVSLRHLVLKIISESPAITIQNTIDKALEAAGLSKTALNQTIVSELLRQQMPIDKKTISLLIQQALNYKNTPVSELILMNRLQIPVSKEQVEQFHTFINKNSNLMHNVEALAEQLTKLFDIDNSLSYSDNILRSKEILQIILTNVTGGDSVNNSVTSDSLAANDLLLVSSDSNLSQNPPASDPLLLSDIVTEEELRNFSSYIKENNEVFIAFPEKLMGQIENGTANVNDISSLLKQLLQTDETAFLKLNNDQHQVMDKILPSPIPLPNHDSMISSILNHKEIENLTKLLNQFSLPDNIKSQLQAGTISKDEVLQWIKNNLDSSSEIPIRNLFQSREFKILVKESLLDQWTITPDALKNVELEKYYDSLSRKMRELTEFTEQNVKSTGDGVLNQAKNIQQNLNLTQTLNEIFHYIPLPLKLQNQTTHGELYVYTKKKPSGSDSEGIRILLHLDMEHLGPVDIHLNLHGNILTSKFYLEDSDTVSLISEHVNNLEQHLEEKGYTVHMEILKREKEIELMEEILNQNTSTSLLSRYNFDVRA